MTDKNLYLSEMEKSIEDKLFFLDKIGEPQFITDFGCADGKLTIAIAEHLPVVKVIGYDIDKEQILQNKKSNDEFWNIGNLCFIDYLPNHYDTIVLSSVIHEVLSYCNKRKVRKFWNYVFKHKQIVIRDMVVTEKIKYETDELDYHKMLKWAIWNGRAEQTIDFVRIHGSLEIRKNFIHFLLKYRYQTNWEREVKENYLPLSFGSLIDIIPNTHSIGYSKHYVLPFVYETVKKDFDIEIKDNTHLQMILSRRD